MRRPAAILLLLLLTSCRYYDAGKHAAAAAVINSFLHLQARAPLTQSATHPAVSAPDRAGRLIASSSAIPQVALVRCRKKSVRLANL